MGVWGAHTKDNGYTLFKKHPHKSSVDFLRCVLECIEAWQEWFPRDLVKPKNQSKFTKHYKTLLKKKIKFPTTKKFFRPPER